MLFSLLIDPSTAKYTKITHVDRRGRANNYSAFPISFLGQLKDEILTIHLDEVICSIQGGDDAVPFSLKELVFIAHPETGEDITALEWFNSLDVANSDEINAKLASYYPHSSFGRRRERTFPHFKTIWRRIFG